MPSFRVTPSEILEEKRKIFQIKLEQAGIFDLFRKALTALREKFMEDALPEDPMEFIKEQLGVVKIDPMKIEILKEELHALQDKLKNYDENFGQVYNEEQNNAALDSNFNACGLFYMTNNDYGDHSAGSPKMEPILHKPTIFKSDSIPVNDESLLYSDAKSKFERRVFHSSPCSDDIDSSFKSKCESSFQKLDSSESDNTDATNSDGDFSRFTIAKSKSQHGIQRIFYSTPCRDDMDSSFKFKCESSFSKMESSELDSACAANSDHDSCKFVNLKPKLRVPGGPMVESKREECRKMMEKLGILLLLERGLSALLMEPVFPEDPKAFLLENFQTHSLEFHEIQALKNEIAIVRNRLKEMMRRDEVVESDFSDELQS